MFKISAEEKRMILKRRKKVEGAQSIERMFSQALNYMEKANDVLEEITELISNEEISYSQPQEKASSTMLGLMEDARLLCQYAIKGRGKYPRLDELYRKFGI